MNIKLCIALFCAFFFSAASAQDKSSIAEVGRAVLTLPQGSWTLIASEDSANTLNGIASLPTQSKAYVLKNNSGEVLALLLLNASKGGVGLTTQWTNTCTATATTYAQAGTERFNLLSCAKATVPLKMSIYLPIAAPYVSNAIAPISLPNLMVSISATNGNSNGTMVSVNLLVVPEFSGLDGTPKGQIPAKVNPKHAAWADLLLKNLEESVNSLSGKASIPSQGFQ